MPKRHIPIYQVDAFTDRPFAGNPAAVCPLTEPLPEALMRQIAAENNLSETAFIVPEASGREAGKEPGNWSIRWFTPEVEVDLCGHATLASGAVVLTLLEPHLSAVTFHCKFGPLTVARHDGGFRLDFPARPPRPFDGPAEVATLLTDALGAAPSTLIAARDVIAVFDSAEAVRALTPDFAKLAQIPGYFAVGVTAPGSGADGDVDFVSRFFAPAKGIDEDPVTGSLHCTLTPYWADRLGKGTLAARQVSRRQGDLKVALRGDRVDLIGNAVLVMVGQLMI